MAIQHKHVSVNLAAFNSAKYLGGLSNLSREATVILFRMLVVHERVSPNTTYGKELISNSFANTFGQLQGWVASYMGEAISELLDGAGRDLMPQAVPTSISQLGHSTVKGRSKSSATVGQFTKKVINVAFTLNRDVLTMAQGIRDTLDTGSSDPMVLAVCSTDILPEEFYFPISYDYRGRAYYRGGIINPQGSDLQKGLLMFADKAPIGPHGRFALYMAFANAAKLDQGTKAEQYARVHNTDWSVYARGEAGLKKPFQAAGLASELLRLTTWTNTGAAEEDFQSGVVCHQDATCSGLQIAAAITGHRPTAEATNCTARTMQQGKADVYGKVATHVANSHIVAAIVDLAAKYGREMVKKAVMTLGYGAGADTLCTSTEEWLKNPKNAGEHICLVERRETDVVDTPSRELLLESINKECFATVSLKNQLQEVAKSNVDPITWTTHDGFVAVQEKTSGERVTIGKFSMDFDIHWDNDLNITAIAPNFVHSLDAAQMRDAVSQLGNIPIACIHDSLGTRACDYVQAATAVRKAFVNIDARGCTQRFLATAGLTLDILGDYNASEAEHSSYFWC